MLTRHRPREVGATQVCIREHGVVELGVPEVGPGEVRTREVDAPQVDASEVQPCSYRIVVQVSAPDNIELGAGARFDGDRIDDAPCFGATSASTT